MNPLSSPPLPAVDPFLPVWLGGRPVPPLPELAEVADDFVDRDGGRFCRISQYDRLSPFLMTIVSAFDHWLFVASNGGLTAGRVNSERALFPYQSVDRLYDSAATTGPFTCLVVTRGERTQLWEPFHRAGRFAHRLSRHLYKSIEGHRIIFEEISHDLGLTFSAEWTTSDRFGFVRRVRLTNDLAAPVAVRVMDGLRNILPAGVPRRLQNEMSCLTDAYKRSERVADTNLAVFALSTGITDQPEALESLVAAVAWSDGLPDATVLLTDRQLEAFRQGAWPREEADARGVRGCYALAARLELEAEETRHWLLVADQGRTQADVVQLAAMLRDGGAGELVVADVDAGGRRLRAIVGGADGLQVGGDESATAHHFANVLFNVMRGGAFLNGEGIPTDDFAAFVAERNHAVARRHALWLRELPATLPNAELGRRVSERDEADLTRLFLEYLPLGFARRHGDPSRPWNHFSIRLRDGAGRDAFEYEGNWRDIFQNWEALGTAFPGFLEHMVAKFVNASTLDGHNPYRVTRRGVEWERPAPDDPWAGIGYWGDHQIIYLLKLLEWAEHFAPGRFHQWLERAVFSYTAVPYRIAAYEQMRRDPRATIAFDAEQDAAITAREVAEGTDARLVHDADGNVRHVTLTEKLLVTVLARLANLIPGGGIWMNTQRPEWNDANNALVGYGVSGVTLCHLRRYLVFCRQLFAGRDGRDVVLSAAVADFATAISAGLQTGADDFAAVARDPVARRAMVDRLSTAGSRHRERVYAHGPGEPVTFASADMRAVLDLALQLVDASVHALRRPDGLFHAYRLLHFTGEHALTLDDLPLMLEGQVAVLTAGILAPDEAVALLRALRTSALYRNDQQSYLLYPDGNPAGFLQRNVVPESLVAASPLLSALLSAADTRLVRRDAQGAVRFHPDLVNAAALEERLEQLAGDATWGQLIHAHAASVRDAYECVFAHRSFTGRSGTMFAYEGLGSVYWHMVSKLLLAVQEIHAAASVAQHPASAELARAYFAIRAGLGFKKTPVEWGAFPTDPYSHTPGHAGAQQPGMTGQVKEGILARLGELGVVIESGRVRFAPVLLQVDEFLPCAHEFVWYDASRAEQRVTLPAATLAFTFCGTLIVYTLVTGDSLAVAVTRTGQAPVAQAAAELSAEDAGELFTRTGAIARIDVAIGRGCLVSQAPDA